MKVLFITYCRAMFGANISMLNLILDLRDKYHVEPVVLMPSIVDGDLENNLIDKNIRYYSFVQKPWVISSFDKFKKIKTISFFVKNCFYLSNISRKLVHEKFDLIYSNNSTIQTGAFLSKKWSIPHVWHIREFAKLHYNIDFSYPNSYVKSCFSRANKLIATSESLKEYVDNNYTYSNNCVCVYNGISIESPKRTSFNFNSIINFCYVGALEEGKRQLELLNAALLLRNSGYNNFKIHLIGSGLSYQKLLTQFVVDNNLESFIIFHGYKKNVTEILSQMDVGIICSLLEAFGRATCEYMANCLPVIGADSGGTRELIENNVTGFLYTPGDISSLSMYMKKYIDNRSLLQIHGSAAFEKVAKDYSIENNTSAIYSIFEEVVN